MLQEKQQTNRLWSGSHSPVQWCVGRRLAALVALALGDQASVFAVQQILLEERWGNKTS